jgi:hypothetical protein
MVAGLHLSHPLVLETDHLRPYGEPRTANRELQTANHELQTANRKPQTANRKPQTANRELFPQWAGHSANYESLHKESSSFSPGGGLVPSFAKIVPLPIWKSWFLFMVDINRLSHIPHFADGIAQLGSQRLFSPCRSTLSKPWVGGPGIGQESRTQPKCNCCSASNGSNWVCSGFVVQLSLTVCALLASCAWSQK